MSIRRIQFVIVPHQYRIWFRLSATLLKTSLKIMANISLERPPPYRWIEFKFVVGCVAPEWTPNNWFTSNKCKLSLQEDTTIENFSLKKSLIEMYRIVFPRWNLIINEEVLINKWNTDYVSNTRLEDSRKVNQIYRPCLYYI